MNRVETQVANLRTRVDRIQNVVEVLAPGSFEGPVSGVVKAPRPEAPAFPPAIDVIRSKRVMLINCYGGHHDKTDIEPNDNLFGLNPRYRGEEGPHWVLGEIRRGYEAGFRDFFINRPVGQARDPENPDTHPHVSANSWAPMSTAKRMSWVSVMSVVRTEMPDAKIIVFIGATGYSVQDPRGQTPRAAGEPLWVGHETFREATLDRWLEIGVHGFGIDTGAAMDFVITDRGSERKREALYRLGEDLSDRWHGVQIIGEAMPQSRGAWDENAISRLSYIATAEYFAHRENLLDRDFKTHSAFGDHPMYWWAAGPAWNNASAIERAEMVDRMEQLGYVTVIDDVSFSPITEAIG